MQSKYAHNLVWIDLEMTGLNPDQHVIIEVAAIITTSNLDIIHEFPSYVIYQPESELAKMDSWNVRTHNSSGLVEKIKTSQYSIEIVQNEILRLIKQYVPVNNSPLCGNTVHQDRLFLAKYMPKVEQYLHYRNLDVSVIKELAKRWYPEIYAGFVKKNQHRALDDIKESIEELKFYKQHLFINSN